MEKASKLNVKITSPTIVVITFFCLYTITRLYVLFRHGPFVEPDSGGYRSNPHGFGFTQDLAKVSLIGNSFRPFPVNIFYAISPNDSVRLVLQVLLAASAWSYFIWNMKSSGRKIWLAVFFAGLFALNPGMIYRDLVLLPDSFSLSLFIFIFTLCATEKWRSKSQKIVLLSLLLLLVIQRPTLWISFFLFSLLLGLIAIRARDSVNKWKFATGLLILAVIGFSYNQIQSVYGWPKYFNTSYPVTKNAFPIGLLIWKDNSLNEEWEKNLFKANYPKCGEISNSDSGPWEYSVRAFGECKDASNWLTKNFNTFFLKTLFRDPGLIFKQIQIEFPHTFIPTPDAYAFDSVSKMHLIPHLPRFEYFGFPQFRGLNYILSNNPLFFWVPLCAAIILRQRKHFRRTLGTLKTTLLISFVFALSIMVDNILMPSDNFRHNLPLNIGILFMTYWYVSGFVSNRAKKQRNGRDSNDEIK